ncbi:MAG TPA: histidine kinase dimerization/phospho-acceptor domain-containing protein, partial [Flavisolibacter sp.]|nr:histidine kinase dimerization/phospho-acceptor domain-containing protein [Flavisolibacter sp.]
NDKELLAQSYSLIGTVFFYAKDYQRALQYCLKAKEVGVSPFGKPEILLGFIGEAYFHLGQLDSAYAYLKKAYDLDVKSKNYHWAIPYYYLAAIDVKKGHPAKAIDLYRMSIQLEVEKLSLLKGYNGIAEAFRQNGQMDSAVIYARKAVNVGMSASVLDPVLDATALLVDIYKERGETDSVLKYQNLMLTAKDSLYSSDKIRQLENVAFNESLRQQEMDAEQEQYKNRMMLYGLAVILMASVAVGVVLYRSNKRKQQVNALLERQKLEIQDALDRLSTTQQQLLQQEKMASLGELTAGIAHEIQNPLNFVNNFAEANQGLLEELEQASERNDWAEVKELTKDIRANEEKINHHGRRADSIVKNMLQHARGAAGDKQLTDINALVDEYLRLAYHGCRSKDKCFAPALRSSYEDGLAKITVAPQEIGRVLLNLFNNAFYAIGEKVKLGDATYEPTIWVNTKREG